MAFDCLKDAWISMISAELVMPMKTGCMPRRSYSGCVSGTSNLGFVLEKYFK